VERARGISVTVALGLAILVTLGALNALHPSQGMVPRSPSTDRMDSKASLAIAAPPAPLGGWWQLPTPGSVLGNLTGFQMAYDSEDGYVLLFGGCPDTSVPALDGCANPSNETWSYSNGTWSQLHPSDFPPGRYFGMMADDPAAGYVVLFGGANASGLLNDTWAFSGGTWVQLHPAHSPPELQEAGLAYDRVASEVVLFGGLIPGALNASYETWTFIRGNWVNVTESPHPPGWVSPTMAPDPAGGVLLHGGITALFFPTYDQQTWTFGLYAWTNVTAASGPEPPPSVLYALATFDPVRNETLVFGGGDSTEIAYGTWAYSSFGKWTQVLLGTQGPPGGFYEMGGAFDVKDNYTVEFGEEGIGSFYGLPEIVSVTNSTWVLLTSLVDAGIQWNGSARVSSALNFSGNVSGGLGPYQYYWSFGDGTFSNSPQPVHAYDRTGSFEVNLTVTDRVDQKSNASAFVNVSTPGTGLPAGTILTYGIVATAAIMAAAVVALLWQRKRGPGPKPPTASEASTPTGKEPG
jgi:PKD domain/Galactose oxidase, central domain